MWGEFSNSTLAWQNAIDTTTASTNVQSNRPSLERRRTAVPSMVTEAQMLGNELKILYVLQFPNVWDVD